MHELGQHATPLMRLHPESRCAGIHQSNDKKESQHQNSPKRGRKFTYFAPTGSLLGTPFHSKKYRLTLRLTNIPFGQNASPPEAQSLLHAFPLTSLDRAFSYASVSHRLMLLRNALLLSTLTDMHTARSPTLSAFLHNFS